MPDLLLELQGEQFRRAYLLYIVEICHGKEKYYYVGQTGDNRYITARPAFRRLAAHFEDTGNSTQNQVYRYIAETILGILEPDHKKALSIAVKEQSEGYLVNSLIRLYAYEAQPFNNSVDHAEHLAVVRKLRTLEQWVINSFQTSGSVVMNRHIRRQLPTWPYPEIVKRIKGAFGLLPRSP